MKSVAITGASGVVGARVLDLLLARDDVGRIVALGRRPLATRHDKLVSKVVELQSVAAMERELPDGIDLAICCLGTTMKQAGSKEAFRAVDRDAVVAFGEAALHRGARRFLLVSSLGASAGAGGFYLRTKGEAEEAMARLGFPQLTILRPSFIDDEGTRKDDRLGERLTLPVARALFAVLGKTRRFAPIPAGVIARALERLAFDETAQPVRTVQSEELHVLGS
jgi:uncharacterized protein YbjT (DUF2867 family)